VCTSLFISYNIKVKYVCVCVLLMVKKLILIYLWHTSWHHEFETTGSVFSRMTTMISILRDFKPILDLDLYGEHMPEERMTGSKIDLDLSARLTYTWVYMVYNFTQKMKYYYIMFTKHEKSNKHIDIRNTYTVELPEGINSSWLLLLLPKLCTRIISIT